MLNSDDVAAQEEEIGGTEVHAPCETGDGFARGFAAEAGADPEWDGPGHRRGGTTHHHMMNERWIDSISPDAFPDPPLPSLACWLHASACLLVSVDSTPALPLGLGRVGSGRSRSIDHAPGSIARSASPRLGAAAPNICFYFLIFSA